MRGYLVKKGGRYYTVVYEGTDPLTRKQRRSWTPAGKNRREAERQLAELVQARNGRGPVFVGRVTLRGKKARAHYEEVGKTDAMNPRTENGAKA